MRDLETGFRTLTWFCYRDLQKHQVTFLNSLSTQNRPATRTLTYELIRKGKRIQLPVLWKITPFFYLLTRSLNFDLTRMRIVIV